MLVVDLHCEHGHVFEGWFASADDLASQQARGLVSCPVCASTEVVRRPSATRLNVASLKAEKAAGGVGQASLPGAEAPGVPAAADVAKGPEAPSGDAPQRAVRGQADQQEVAELKEEGIDVMSLPIPESLKGPLQ